MSTYNAARAGVALCFVLAVVFFFDACTPGAFERTAALIACPAIYGLGCYFNLRALTAHIDQRRPLAQGEIVHWRRAMTRAFYGTVALAIMTLIGRFIPSRSLWWIPVGVVFLAFIFAVDRASMKKAERDENREGPTNGRAK
jgi:hypothetical protein